jgi:hypothetical protein
MIKNVLQQTGTCAELLLQLRLSGDTLNISAKDSEETERCYAQTGIFPKQQKSLKCSLMYAYCNWPVVIVFEDAHIKYHAKVMV